VDWKPERAIQAKVRDFSKKKKYITKKHDCWGAPMEEHSTLVYKWQLLPDFESTMGFAPKRHQLLPSTGCYPVCSSIYSQWHHHQGSLPSVCTAMSLCLLSYLFCLISSSSSVMCNYTVLQSSTIYTVIRITFIHTFIQLHIHTLILSHINAYTTYTWYQFLHGCISHPSLVWSYPFSLVLTYHCVKQISCNRCLSFCAKRIACNYLFVTLASG